VRQQCPGEKCKKIFFFALGAKNLCVRQIEATDIESHFCVPSACSSRAPTDSESTFCVQSGQVCVQNSLPSCLQRVCEGELKEPGIFAEKEPDVVFLALISHDLGSHEWPDFIRAEEILLRHREEEREAMFNKRAEELMKDVDESEETILDFD